VLIQSQVVFTQPYRSIGTQPKAWYPVRSKWGKPNQATMTWLNLTHSEVRSFLIRIHFAEHKQRALFSLSAPGNDSLRGLKAILHDLRSPKGQIGASRPVCPENRLKFVRISWIRSPAEHLIHIQTSDWLPDNNKRGNSFASDFALKGDITSCCWDAFASTSLAALSISALWRFFFWFPMFTVKAEHLF